MSGKSAILTLVLAVAAPVPAQLSGTYTIKTDGSGDFQSPGEACESLLVYGIVGNCVFDIYSGTYTRNMWLPNVNTSGTYTIVFRAVPGANVVQSGWMDAPNTNKVKIDGITLNNGMSLSNCSGWRVSGCNISGRIQLAGDSDYDSLIGNSTVSTDDYAVYLEGGHFYMANNFCRMLESPSAYSVVDLAGGWDVELYYNTIYGWCDQSNNGCLSLPGSSTLKNNILMMAGAESPEARCLQIWDVADSMLISDYNCIWVPDSGWAVMADGIEMDLAAWQACGFDLHSIGSDPLLLDTADLHLQSGSPCIGAATPIAGIEEDIDGDNRHPNQPDIGADEATGQTPIPPWPYGWEEVSPMPTGPSGKAVKRGGWLADGGDIIYAAKGCKTDEFYAYHIYGDSWVMLAPIPAGPSGKLADKGCVGCVSRGYVYMTKGSGTTEFWRYNIDLDSWEQLPDVPLGESGRGVKHGNDLVQVRKGRDSTYLYLLKGHKSEFFRYNVETQVWQPLPDAPYGERPKWNKGSWLVKSKSAARVDVLYAHKAKYHEFWMFDLELLTWDTTRLTGMPYIGMMGRRKKCKDGSSAAEYGDFLMALKGGNTQELWRYCTLGDSWDELDTIPAYGSTGKKKRVKHGADLVHFREGAFFALKGNKTLELWRYRYPDTLQLGDGTKAGTAGPVRALDFDIRPNPTNSGRALVSLVGSTKARLEVAVYDVRGCRVAASESAGETDQMLVDLSRLSAGVYLCRVEAGGWTGTRKLIIER